MIYLYDVNKAKLFFVTTAAFFILFGSVGFDVFTHLCDKDGVSVSYFVKNIDPCEGHSDIKKNSCCKTEILDKSCNEEISDNCCTDKFDHINLKLDYVNKTRISPILANLSKILFILHQKEALGNLVAKMDYAKPPPKSCRIVLLEKQCWLI